MSKFPKREQSDFFIDKEGILHFFQASKETEEDMDHLMKKSMEVLSSLKKLPTKGLMDLRGVNFLSMLPFRQKYIQLASMTKKLRKAALLTDNRLLWIYTSFNFNAGKNMKEAAINVKAFTSEEKAMEWLKED